MNKNVIITVATGIGSLVLGAATYAGAAHYIKNHPTNVETENDVVDTETTED